MLKERTAQVGTLQDVQEGIDSLWEALNTEDSYSHLGPDIFRDLLALYLMKFDLVDNYPDLDAAITTAENAIKFMARRPGTRENFAQSGHIPRSSIQIQRKPGRFKSLCSDMATAS